MNALIRNVLFASLLLACQGSEAAQPPFWPKHQIASQTDQLNRELDQIHSATLSYVANHPLPSAAVLAAGGGVASFLVDNIDEDMKTVLRVGAVTGATYCLWTRQNAATCDEAMHELGRLAAAASERRLQLQQLTAR